MPEFIIFGVQGNYYQIADPNIKGETHEKVARKYFENGDRKDWYEKLSVRLADDNNSPSKTFTRKDLGLM